MDATLNTLAKIIQSSWVSRDVLADDNASPDFASMLLQALEKEFPSTQDSSATLNTQLSSVSPSSMLSLTWFGGFCRATGSGVRKEVRGRSRAGPIGDQSRVRFQPKRGFPSRSQRSNAS